MKKSRLTILAAAFFCLAIFAQQSRAKNLRGFTPPAKPDLEITSAVAQSKLSVAFTIVSRGADVPANTVTIYVIMTAPGSKNTIWDDQHAYVIGQPLKADVPANFTIQMPEDKTLESKYINLLIDPDNKVDESNEQNNVSKTFNGPPKPANFPDLPPIDLQLMQWTINDETTVSLTVISRKKPSPAGSFEVRVAATNKDGTPAWEKQATFPVDIPADKLGTMEFKAPEGKDFVGKKFRVLVDSGDEVPEHNESNNNSGPFNTTVLDKLLKADVRFKEEIYYKLGQKDSQAGTPTAALKVHKSGTTCCNYGSNVAEITVRILMAAAADKIALPTFTLSNLTTGQTFDYPTTIAIEPGQTSIDKTFQVPLKDGPNKLKFELGSSFSFKDTDPTNNTLEVTANLIADK